MPNFLVCDRVYFFQKLLVQSKSDKIIFEIQISAVNNKGISQSVTRKLKDVRKPLNKVHLKQGCRFGQNRLQFKHNND